MTKRTFFFGLLVAAAVSAFSACGGGGGSGIGLTPGAPSRPGSPSSAATKGAQIHVVIPQRTSSSSSVRRPNFISQSTASFQVIVTLVNGVAPNPAPTPMVVVIATSPFCTGQGTSSVSCTIIVQVPIATSVQLELESFDASGNLLGKAQIGPINTTLPTIPPQSISVGGVPATVNISPNTLSAADDSATHTVTFNVTAQDAGGNTIVQPGNYPSPINLTIAGDPNASLSLSTTAIGSPGPNNGATAVTLSYNSAKALTTAATITATSGTNTATLSFAPLIVTPMSLPAVLVGGSTQQLTVSEPGYSGAFKVTGPTTATLATLSCVQANCTPASAGGSVTVNVAPGTGFGNDSITIADANGASFNVPLTVTQTGGGGTLVGNPPTVYRYPANGKTYGIITGPDGQSIWYVDQTTGAVGAIAHPGSCAAAASTCPSAEASVPSMPSLPAALTQIVTGSEGSLYLIDAGNGSSDTGALVQMTGCVASTATCGGTAFTQSTYFSSYGAPAAVATDPFGDIYMGVNGTNFGGTMIWQPVNGCCFNGSNNVNIGSTPAAVGNIAFDVNGNTWFIDTGNNAVGFVVNYTLQGAPSGIVGPCINDCYAFESNGTQSGVSVGPSGGLAHRVPTPVRIERTRPIKRRNVCCLVAPTFTGPLTDIALGPDGNFYVADQGAHTIDVIVPSTWMVAPPCTATTCTVSQVNLPISGAKPQNIVAGPDGNVWFTDATGFIGVIALNTCTPTCKVYEYSVGGAPWGITVGPDGDIWFTDSTNSSIGKVVLQ